MGRSKNELGFIDITEINNKPIQTRCIRYQLTGVISRSVPALFNSNDLRHIIGFVTSGAASYYPVIDSVKLLRVGLTVLSEDSITAGSFSFNWKGSNAPDITETMFFSPGVPARRNFYPPEDSSARWWYDNASTTTDLFQLYMSNNEIPLFFLDIEFEYNLQDGASVNSVFTTNATFTGYAYRILPLASEQFTPLGLNAVS